MSCSPRPILKLRILNIHESLYEKLANRLNLSILPDSMSHVTADKKPMEVSGVTTVPSICVHDSFGDIAISRNIQFRVAKGLNFHCILGAEAHAALCHDYLKLSRKNHF